MRLNIFSEKMVEKKYTDIGEIVNAFTFFDPFLPLWINIVLVGETDNFLTIRLDCSRRFRKPSMLRNQNTGYPPFKVILDIDNEEC